MTDPPFVHPATPPAFLLVVSGPSGVGKSVLCQRLVQADDRLVHSVSATTRGARPGETDGTDYFFLDEPTFRKGVSDGDFLEWAEVYGHLYGTPRAPVKEHIAAGRTPVLNVDVQGGRSVKALLPDAVLVFLAPPSLEELEERLRGRRTDSEERIRGRLAEAREEMARVRDYDYLVVNDDLEATVATVRAMISAERHRVSRIPK
jgi:guanylate kinase